MTPDLGQPWWVVLLCFVENAGVAFLAMRAIEGKSDQRLVGALAIATGIVGVWNFKSGVAVFPGLVFVWCLCTVLGAAVCADLRTRRIPPLLVLPALAFTIVLDVMHGDVGALATGVVIGLVFGIAWLRTRNAPDGAASGLGDAGLAGLAGFALGLELGTIVVAVACFAAAGIAFARKKRGTVAFAPYLAATIEIALLLPAR